MFKTLQQNISFLKRQQIPVILTIKLLVYRVFSFCICYDFEEYFEKKYKNLRTLKFQMKEFSKRLDIERILFKKDNYQVAQEKSLQKLNKSREASYKQNSIISAQSLDLEELPQKIKKPELAEKSSDRVIPFQEQAKNDKKML